MGKMFSKHDDVLEVRDYHEFVQNRSLWRKPLSVTYNPFTNATPIWLWSYENRPSLLTTQLVKNITILSSQQKQRFPSTSDHETSNVYDSCHELVDMTGLWIFAVRDCCDSVDCIWRRLAFTFLDGTLAYYGERLQISPTNRNKDGWHVFRVYTHNAQDATHVLASEEIIRHRGVRSTMSYFTGDQRYPSYVSYYNEDDGHISVIVHRNNSDGRKLKEYQSTPLPMRHRCADCIRPVAHDTIEEL